MAAFSVEPMALFQDIATAARFDVSSQPPTDAGPIWRGEAETLR
jgi:hypothetical protein